MVPLYVQYMGSEAYGLVGFFAMLQAWFQLLDMGLTPTMVRTAAQFNGGAIDALSLRKLLRALEGIFIAVALLGGIAILLGSEAIATGWLKVQLLPLEEVRNAIMIMAVIIALRWVCGLHRGVINGFERLVWLSNFNIVMATARFVLVIPFFVYVGTSPTEFFSYQLLLAVIELIVLVVQAYRLLPNVDVSQRIQFQWEPLSSVLKFSISIAFTSSVWVFVTQTDKLILSNLLPLKDYAYFTLAVLVASGVMVISGPISSALLPRLTKLSAEGNDGELIRLYRNATQMVSVIAIPLALVLTFFAEQVLWAWTGDANIARNVAPTLTLYALGNGILALAAFPYYLQFAKSDLKLHLIGSALFLVLLIPALIWSTMQYGVIGAGYAWLGANVIYFLVWVPKVHESFFKGLHAKWILQDVGVIGLFNFFSCLAIKALVDFPQSRMQVLFVIVIISVSLLLISLLSSSFLRIQLHNKWEAFNWK